MEYMTHVLKTIPYMFCDFHGHSNRKNCFFYGCSAKKSWLKMDSAKLENETDFMVSTLDDLLIKIVFNLISFFKVMKYINKKTASYVNIAFFL